LSKISNGNQNKNYSYGGSISTDEVSRYTRFYRHIIDKITSQYPAEKKSISTLLREEFPSIKLRDGSVHMFSREDLRNFLEVVDNELSNKSVLPIVVGKISGTSLYKIVDCNKDYVDLLRKLVEKKIIAEDTIEINECLLRYDAIKTLLKKFYSLIILTIIQDSYSGWDISSEREAL
jgi:uncharacterized protein (UPF0216 family)